MCDSGFSQRCWRILQSSRISHHWLTSFTDVSEEGNACLLSVVERENKFLGELGALGRESEPIDSNKCPGKLFFLVTYEIEALSCPERSEQIVCGQASCVSFGVLPGVSLSIQLLRVVTPCRWVMFPDVSGHLSAFVFQCEEVLKDFALLHTWRRIQGTLTKQHGVTSRTT